MTILDIKGVSKTFLADPLTMLKSGYTLLAEMGLA